MTAFQTIIGEYYGLDWATLVLGVSANYLLTGGRLRIGFALNILACLCAFSVAAMSHQNGFLVFNGLLIAINMRGVMRGDRRAQVEESAMAQPVRVNSR
ncbi:MAG: hypothetical protein H6865_00990 [Rhodospirillales bacterium]|nr:hypothetical protein [Alphaproteobacteria bacterium]MCB9986202.1 hypothetical protein [Rhodospirillales bacterium]USO07241.1 MAG: hypothetical protein H6866_07380 [Rhodospirillales bacterium]